MKECECFYIGKKIIYVEGCACGLCTLVPGMKEYECCCIGTEILYVERLYFCTL